MANNKKQVVAAKPNNGNKSKKSKKGMWIAIAAAAVLVVAGIAAYLVLNFSPIGEQRKMESYLKGKYGKEFVVTNVRTEGATIGIQGQQTGDAYPVNDKTLSFEVGRYSTGTFYDKYPGTIWAKQESEPDRQFLTTVFEQMPEWRLDITLAYKSKYQITGTVPDFKIAQGRYSDDIVYGITVKMSGDLTSSNRLDHQTKAFKIIEYLRSKHVGKPSVRYVININNQDARYVCDLYDDALEKIQSSNDLNNCFKRLEGKE